MRRIDWVVSNICVLSRCALPAAFLAMLWGCGPSTTDLQSRVDELQQELEQQGRQIDALSVAYESHRGVLERLSAWEQVEFLVDNVQFQVVEQAFEPLIVGKADLKLTGKAKPELIFVEWAVTVKHKDRVLEPATYIQRVEKGAATLKIVYPLPSHSIAKKDVSLKVQPTGWYLAQVARISE